MSTRLQTGLGLLRDVIVAVIGLLILFGVEISNDQVAGILLVVATVAALGSWAYNMYQSKQNVEVTPPPKTTTRTKP